LGESKRLKIQTILFELSVGQNVVDHYHVWQGDVFVRVCNGQGHVHC